jgi:hypothetical protein
MPPNPCGELGFAERTGSNGDDRGHNFRLRGDEFPAIQIEEDRQRNEANPFIAVGVAMIGVSKIPYSVSTAKALSPAARFSRSVITLGSVVPSDPPYVRKVISLIIVVMLPSLSNCRVDAP